MTFRIRTKGLARGRIRHSSTSLDQPKPKSERTEEQKADPCGAFFRPYDQVTRSLETLIMRWRGHRPGRSCIGDKRRFNSIRYQRPKPRASAELQQQLPRQGIDNAGINSTKFQPHTSASTSKDIVTIERNRQGIGYHGIERSIIPKVVVKESR